MLVSTEIMKKLAYARAGKEYEGFTVMENKLEDTSRWSLHYHLVVKHGDKFYATSYSKGSTENQDQFPFDDEGDEIELVEVFPHVVEIVTYKYPSENS